MPKQLREYPIYLAPQIKGHIKPDGGYEVYDEKTNTYVNPQDIDDKIKIYERQVKGWFLDRASDFLKNEDNDFIVLMIAISYIEGVEQYRTVNGNGEGSRRVFTRGLRRIFSLSEEQTKLDEFYDQVRCGLFHTGMTRNKVILRRSFEKPIDFSEPCVIKINPKKFLFEVKKDFDKYIEILKNRENAVDRGNFDRLFSNLQPISSV